MPRGNGGIIGPVNTSFSGVWSLTEAQLRRSANTWPNFYTALLSESATGSDVFSTQGADPFFEYTTLLLPGNGTNGAQNNTFLDGSTNNFTITRNGNTTQGTFSPFSQTGWGNYFDGTGDSIYASSANTANAMGTGDWTIEASVYKTNSTEGYVFDTLALTGGSTDAIRISISSSGAVYFYKYSTLLTSGGSIALNTWNHIAVVRQSQTIKIYLNGTQVNTTYSDTGSNYTCGTNRPLVGINGYDIASDPFQGYISNLRAVKGVAVYTGNFTPPTSPLAATQSAGTNISAITGTQTSLLTCQSNRFIDNSTNNFTITRNGDTRVVAFSPFNPTASWSAATNGGSGYFDGNGDTLTAPSGASISGTGDFTVETWIYPTSIPSTYSVMVAGDTSGSLAAFILNGTTGLSGAPSGSISFGRTLIAPEGNTSNTINWNAWNHLLISRVSGTLKLFINGVQGYSAANSTNYASSVIRIGSDGGGTNNLYVGYMCGTKYVQGTGVTSVTVPTTPPTATSGTSLLLNFTNAGVYDATSKNDLETVGNAQISTTQFQFAPSSMAFDGNGDYLIMPDAQTGQFLTGDFTVEYWCRFGSQGTNYAPQVGTLTSVSPSGTWRFGTFTNNGGVYLAYHNGSSYVDVQFGSTVYNDNTWRHFALTRSGTTVRAFVNGTQVGTNQTVSQNFNSSNKVSVGAELLNPTYFNGYIQDLRITKGYARYTANFTAPTAAFPTL